MASLELPYVSTGHLPDLYHKLTPRQIGRCGFALCTVALLWLAFAVRSDWSEILFFFGLVLFGIGQGSLVPLAGDVGSLRGTAQNLAAAVNTAVAGALLVGLSSTIALSKITANPLLTKELQGQVDLDNITFVGNDRPRRVLESTTGTPQQIEQAVEVNTEHACEP